ncbi:MAG: hypothetical protein IKM57_02045, partial [Paludibacteraceae bacterium]|nr:hypothetical protein [Paludibacteraceae bacterium]
NENRTIAKKRIMHPTAISPANKHAIAKRPQADANTIRISLNKQLPVFPIIFKAINCKLTHIRYVSTYQYGISQPQI